MRRAVVRSRGDAGRRPSTSGSGSPRAARRLLLLGAFAPGVALGRASRSRSRNAAPVVGVHAHLDRQHARRRPTRSRTPRGPRRAVGRRRAGRPDATAGPCARPGRRSARAPPRAGIPRCRARRSASGRAPSSRTAAPRRTPPPISGRHCSARATRTCSRAAPGDRPHCQASQWAQDMIPYPCQPSRSSNSAISRSQAAVAAASRTAPAVIAAASSGSGLPDGCSERDDSAMARSFESLFEG